MEIPSTSCQVTFGAAPHRGDGRLAATLIKSASAECDILESERPTMATPAYKFVVMATLERQELVLSENTAATAVDATIVHASLNAQFCQFMNFFCDIYNTESCVESSAGLSCRRGDRQAPPSAGFTIPSVFSHSCKY